MATRTHLPEDEYLRKIGLVAYLVTAVEGLLLFDLPRLAEVLPPELNVNSMAGMTTRQLGEMFLAHAARCTDREVVAYLTAGGHALVEIGPKRNDLLHARPATDSDGRTRLYRWLPPHAHFLDDSWLDHFADRVDELQAELNVLRPPLSST